MKEVSRTAKFIASLFLLCLLYILVGCGGSGGGSGFLPEFLWVETDIVVSDIDSDGRNDVVTLAMLSNTSDYSREGYLKVYRQRVQDEFSEPDIYIFGKYPWHLTISDINGDLQPDLLATDVNLENIQLFYNNPRNKGIFLAPQQIASDIYAYYTAIGDFNNDGAFDIASDTTGNSIVIFYQDPSQSGVFLPPVDLPTPGESTSYLVAGDIDGDGLDDLVVWLYLEPSGYTPNGTLAFSLQQDDGTFGEFTTLAPQKGFNVSNLSIADYNDDGRNDLFVFFTPYSVDYTAKVTVLLQQEEPGFFDTPIDTSLASVRGIDDAVVSDLNNDGLPDYAVVGFFPGGSQLNLFFQSGEGSFYLAASYALSISASRITSEDIDNDNLNDLVIYGDQDQVRVLFQSQDQYGNFSAPKPL